MKFLKLFPIFLCMILLSGCTANVAGKLDDYNEIATGTINNNFVGGTSVNLQFEKSGVTCSGLSVIMYTPWKSLLPQMFLIPKCTGQKGYVMLDCSDQTRFRTEWEVTGPFCGKYEGKGFDAYGRKFTYYINLKDNEVAKVLEKYRQDVKDKPQLPCMQKVKHTTSF